MLSHQDWHCVHLAKAATVRFVTQKASSAVPSMPRSCVHKNRAYMVISKIEGESYLSAWLELDEATRKSLFARLEDVFN
jgi:hypothetical protein